MRINGIVSKELLTRPDLFDNEGKPCFIVLKQGAATDLTAGCCAGLESFLCDENGVESVEIAVYNFDKRSGTFSDHGDSGALVFDHLGRMVAILHSGKSKSGGLTSSAHVTYCTPAHWLIPRIMKKYPYADFNRTAWYMREQHPGRQPSTRPTPRPFSFCDSFSCPDARLSIGWFNLVQTDVLLCLFNSYCINPTYC